MSSEKKERRGNEPVTLRLPEELIAAVDAHRRRQSDIPTRPEMIRRILVEWMEQNAPARSPTDRDS
jgi:metal-responsive CopG/Arc/MetJ family transcriptional regulator